MKKIASILLLITVLISSFTLTFADIQPSGDGNIEYKGPTKEEVSIDQSREAIKKVKISNSGPSIIGEGYYKSLSVPTFQQETSYYCGPATAKQTIHFINGSSLSQVQYAAILNTDGLGYTVLDDLKNLINNKQSRRTYITATVSSRAQFEAKTENALRAGVPVVLHIKGDVALGWKYTNGGGHYLNASGLDYYYYTSTNFNSKTKVTDPWILGLGDTWYTTQQVYDVVDNRLNYILY